MLQERLLFTKRLAKLVKVLDHRWCALSNEHLAMIIGNYLQLHLSMCLVFDRLIFLFVYFVYNTLLYCVRHAALYDDYCSNTYTHSHMYRLIKWTTTCCFCCCSLMVLSSHTNTDCHRLLLLQLCSDILFDYHQNTGEIASLSTNVSIFV